MQPASRDHGRGTARIDTLVDAAFVAKSDTTWTLTGSGMAGVRSQVAPVRELA